MANNTLTTAEMESLVQRSLLTSSELEFVWDQLENNSEYHIQYNLQPGEISAGYITAKDLTGQILRLGVVTDRYFKQGYLNDIEEIDAKASGVYLFDIVDTRENGFRRMVETLYDVDKIQGSRYLESFLNGGLVFKFIQEEVESKYYIDPYHYFSIPIGVRSREGMIGSARIILRSSLLGLPIADKRIIEGDIATYSIPIEDEYLNYLKSVKAEYSQLAIKNPQGESEELKVAINKAAPALLRSSLEISKLTGLTEWLATIDSKVLALLNGNMYGFDIVKIGDPVFYLGSESTPVYIDIFKVLDGAKNSNIPKVQRKAHFMDGGKLSEEFAWYRGK